MDPDIQHFLVIYDIKARVADVHGFGSDYDSALEEYSRLEEESRENSNLDIVLLSAESLATVKRTHSSYFETRTFESLLPEGVLEPA